MDDNTLRVMLAAALGPAFWGLVFYLWERGPGRGRARRAAEQREKSRQRALLFGRKLGAWCARRLR